MAPNGSLYYSINGSSLRFIPKDELKGTARIPNSIYFEDLKKGRLNHIGVPIPSIAITY